MSSTTIRIVTQRNWMADELRAALAGTDWTVDQHYGLSAPPPDDAIIWMPGAFAARLSVQGICPPLSSPSGQFLPEMPARFLSREVALFPAILALLKPSEGFWKLADSKDDRFPAKWRTAAELSQDLRVAAVPPAALLQLADVRLDLVAEYRAIISDNAMLGGSFYRDLAGRAHDDPDFADPVQLTHCAAREFVAEVLAELGELGQIGPPSYTLDVGIDRSTGSWVIVEANPIWSSAWYGVNPAIFAAALIHDQMTDPGRWAWKPDPMQLELAARKVPLPFERSAVLLTE